MPVPPLETPKSIGYSAKAEIETKKGTVTIEAVNSDGVFFKKTVRAQDMTIKFDNDCPFGPPTETTDFELLYNVVKDAQDERKKFAVERVEKATLEENNPLLANGGLTTSSTVNFLKEFLIDILRFTVFNTNLGIKEEGVPCHIVKASSSTDLP